jgi:choline-sulfatase
MAGIDQGSEVVSPLDGDSLFELWKGKAENWSDTVYCESFYGGTPAPMFMVRKGRFKYTSCPINPSQLYDLEADPLEMENLAGDPEFESVAKEFETLVHERWDAAQLHHRVVASQRARGLIAQSLSRGKRTHWNFEPAPDQSLGFREELDRYYEWFGTTV